LSTTFQQFVPSYVKTQHSQSREIVADVSDFTKRGERSKVKVASKISFKEIKERRMPSSGMWRRVDLVN
jgi:hypothetical protein